MDDGYYWYFPNNDEAVPDLQGEPQIVEIFSGDSVAVCGSDISQRLSDCSGRFVGPITPPARP